MAPSQSPIGLSVGLKKRNGLHVGRLLGEGAQGAVHAIEDENGEEVPFVAKLAPAPPNSKSKSKKHKEMRQNANSIHKESVFYQSTFPNLCGKVLPSLPNPSTDGLPVYKQSEDEGHGAFHFFVMERMEADLFSILPALVKQGSSKTVNLASVAQKLIDILETFHKLHYVLVDVKPDNFMLATAGRKEKNMADRIRLLDLGLIQSLVSFDGFRKNDSGKELQGTPMYASLNLHDGNTPSRRDDLESIGYLIAELVIRCQALVQGTADQYESSRIPSYLPWSQEPSEEALGKMKRAEVKNSRSTFYQRMPKEAANTLQTYFSEVQQYSFKKEPDYDGLREMLNKLKVPLTKNRAKVASKKATPKLTSTTRRKKRDKAPSDAEDPERKEISSTSSDTRTRRKKNSTETSPLRRSPRRIQSSRSTTNKRGPPSSNKEVIDLTDSDDSSSPPKSAKTGSRTSRTRTKENVANFATERKMNNSGEQRGKLKAVLVATEGPFTGKSWEIMVGRPLFLGSKPSGEDTIVLTNDKKIEKNHARFELFDQNGTTTMSVKDLGSKSGTFVGKALVRKGKITTARHNQSIQVGETTIKFKRFKIR